MARRMLLLFCLVLPALSHPARPPIPQCTEKKEPFANEKNIVCRVEDGQFLDYNDIRMFSSEHANKVFNVTIECTKGGVVELPWPYTAPNVISLQVKGCKTTGFLSERNKKLAYPNQLKYVSLTDVTHMITIPDLFEAIKTVDQWSPDYDCGAERALVQIYRNIGYTFPPSSMNSVDEMMMLEQLMADNNLKKLLSHNTVCYYQNLNYLEESGSRSMSSMHFKLMETTMQYPELKQYSLRNNSFNAVPEELKLLNIGFIPRLSSLDLSDNNIETPDFRFRGKSTHPLVIDLKRNRIENIDKTVLSQLVKDDNIVFDLRENPLICSCEVFSYAQQMLRNIQNQISQTIYHELTCTESNTQKLVFVRDVDSANCK
ncbi:uncharacterized protein LOC128242158 [Mya arenaria]|uniref:uncharacterized protein LOC128242158 n=1 Tax=Mya arenaria TaxID=6604 RepID=UPI0022E85DF0|nr:uncharacterized protein LOC128242158 [Mya arenaria]